jgi:hypothetical protein
MVNIAPYISFSVGFFPSLSSISSSQRVLFCSTGILGPGYGTIGPDFNIVGLAYGLIGLWSVINGAACLTC